MSGPVPVPRLLGRSRESGALDHLLGEARAGRSQVLVIRGEAGIGKTALLHYLAANATDYRVARASGVESESELAFAGLHQLCAPMLGRIGALPEPQRNALATAFGLAAGEPPSRFMVGLAVLSLLAEVAATQPLLCLVDDAQWLDRVSAQTLVFVARRLAAERIACVFAVREPNDAREFSDLPQLRLKGLRGNDALALFDSAIAGRMDARIRARIVAEARGNPLALLELPRGLTAADLAGGFAMPAEHPVAGRIEQSFLVRVRSLPEETQQLLVTAAAEPIGDVSLLRRAAELRGIGPGAAAAAAAAGRRSIAPRPVPTAGAPPAHWPRPATRTQNLIAGPGIGPTRQKEWTSPSPRNWSARPGGRRRAGVSQPRLPSSPGPPNSPRIRPAVGCGH